MAKGQVTLPKEIRERLSVESGDRVVLIWEGDHVAMMNPALYAMRMLQHDMVGQAEQAGFRDDDDVSAYITRMRRT
jgi:AbrB family looped-hinge helix DNA binding protein